jgi:CRP-like cAMP-binding protein
MGPRPSDLSTTPLFAGFAEAELASIAGLFSAVPKSTTQLFDVGEPATTFYLLTAGEVALEVPGDDLYRLRPPALLGELGALTGLPRSSKATPSADAEIWALSAKKIQAYLAEHQELGVRFLVNLLGVVADKVHRDQARLADMRQHVIKTQKELKALREVVLETVETPLSAPVHDTLERLITTNRRVNYRVEPPAALAAQLRLDHGRSPVIDISRTHVTAELTIAPPADGSWLAGVLHLAGVDIPVSGRVHRVRDQRVTIEFDLLIDEYAQILEGYLTRAQLLDILI